MWDNKWWTRSVDAVSCQDYLVSVLALRNVSTKRWWVHTDGENPKSSEMSLAECHVFCLRTNIGWAWIDPGPRDDGTLLLDRRFDIMHIRALSVVTFSVWPLVCSVPRIPVVFLVLKVLPVSRCYWQTSDSLPYAFFACPARMRHFFCYPKYM